jgi:small subunit ribosomal protein S17
MTEQTNTTTTAATAEPSAAPAATGPRGLRKERVGQVVSTKMKKTAVVETTTRVPHAKFGKIVKQVKRFYAHDEESKAQLGDTVRIAETRPLSKLKRWRLVEIIKH